MNIKYKLIYILLFITYSKLIKIVSLAVLKYDIMMIIDSGLHFLG